MRKMLFLVTFLALTIFGVVLPRVSHAACIDEFNSQKKFTSADCLEAVKNVDTCNAITQQLNTCLNPAASGVGSVLGVLSGNGQALGNLLQTAVGSLPGVEGPTCEQTTPFFKYFLAQCQLANPDKFCSEFGKGPGGCCITSHNIDNVPSGQCISDTEQCADKPPTYYSCCFCEYTNNGKTFQTHESSFNQTFESCSALCSAKTIHTEAGDIHPTIYHGLGAGTLEHQSAAPSPRQLQTQAMYCFTATECASGDYQGTFQPGAPGCQSGEGRCIAPEPEITLSYPIGGVTTVKGYRNFVSTVFQYMIGIVGIVAAVAFVWGGFRYIFGSAFENVARSKEIMVDSAIGLILVFSAVAILRTINPATLNLNKLDVFMINKSRILNTDFCSDIKSSPPLKLAKAGSRPDLVPFDKITDADYNVDQSDGACGEDYYAKGFGDFTCKGKKCPGGTGICHKCVSAGDCPEGTKKGASICEEGNFGGNVTYSDCRYVNAVHLFAICSSLKFGAPYITGVATTDKYFQMDYQPAPSRIIDVKSRDWTSSEKGLNRTSVLSTSDEGNQRFLWTITQGDLDAAKAACQPFQGAFQGDPKWTGVEGFVIGIKYQDPGWEFATALSGVCSSVTANDEYGIVGKNNCGGGDLMDGYWEGDTGDALTVSAYKKAIWCSVFAGDHPPLSVLSSGVAQQLNTNNVWTYDELQEAVNGKKSIQCDFNLSKSNAFANPLTGKNNVNKGLAWIMKDGIYCPRIR